MSEVKFSIKNLDIWWMMSVAAHNSRFDFNWTYTTFQRCWRKSQSDFTPVYFQIITKISTFLFQYK